jgi:ferritin
MQNKKTEQLLNEQINKELYSAYLYLAMSSYFQKKNLSGFANWFYVQAQEERDHAMIIYNYMHRIDAPVKLTAIDMPQGDFASVSEVLDKTLEHEKYVTSLIYAILDAANEEKDYKAIQFLQWFVTEQEEEEENATGLIESLKIAGTGEGGLYLMDKDMAQRVYTQAAPLAAENA